MNRWFNTAVFSQPEPFTFGNVGRMLPDVREPGITNFDFSVHKRFPIREEGSLEFRAEFFNAFNTPQFGQPNGSFGNVLFGTINYQANSPREIQFGLKLLWQGLPDKKAMGRHADRMPNVAAAPLARRFRITGADRVIIGSGAIP